MRSMSIWRLAISRRSSSTTSHPGPGPALGVGDARECVFESAVDAASSSLTELRELALPRGRGARAADADVVETVWSASSDPTTTPALPPEAGRRRSVPAAEGSGADTARLSNPTFFGTLVRSERVRSETARGRAVRGT